MIVRPLSLPGLLLVEPSVFRDDRGYFLETFNRQALREAAGIDVEPVQSNISRSRRGVLRGLHYQRRHPQGKYVSCTRGAVFDVAVDLRASSPTFGQWAAARLTEENRCALWIPPGFAHGFLALSDTADLSYLVTTHRVADDEHAIRWDDPALAIDWPLAEAGGRPLVSARDADAPLLAHVPLFD